MDLKALQEKLEKINNKEEYALLVEELNQLLKKSPQEVVLLELLAKVHEKFQQYGQAINIYKNILKLVPDNSFAKSQIELLSTILRYTNTDIYASPNTNMDPWLE